MRKERGARVENRFGMLQRTIIRWHAEISHYRMLPSEAGELGIVIIVKTVKESGEKKVTVKNNIVSYSIMKKCWIFSWSSSYVPRDRLQPRWPFSSRSQCLLNV